MAARIKQITTKAELPVEGQQLFDRIFASRTAGGPFSILLHNIPLADKIDALSMSLGSDSGLTAQEFVLTALAVARAKDCLFVWSVQARNARRDGVSDSAIAAIRDRTSAGLTDDEAALVDYVRQIIGGNRVSQAVFDKLRERHGERWLVGLTSVAGHFGLICAVNNAFEVPPSPEGDPLPI